MGDEDLKTITLALSHGDFQAANILSEDEKIWLIDWEYAAIRSIYFDSLCMRVNSRFHKGLARRLEDFAGDLCHNTQFIFLPTPLHKGNVEMLWVFLMEEFMLKLCEVDTSKIKQKTVNLIPWVREVRSINLEKMPG